MWLGVIKTQAATGGEGTVVKELKVLNQNVRKNPDCSGLIEMILQSHTSEKVRSICFKSSPRQPKTFGSKTANG
jgi:hypothetical protein